MIDSVDDAKEEETKLICQSLPFQRFHIDDLWWMVKQNNSLNSRILLKNFETLESYQYHSNDRLKQRVWLSSRENCRLRWLKTYLSRYSFPPSSQLFRHHTDTVNLLKNDVNFALWIEYRSCNLVASSSYKLSASTDEICQASFGMFDSLILGWNENIVYWAGRL